MVHGAVILSRSIYAPQAGAHPHETCAMPDSRMMRALFCECVCECPRPRAQISMLRGLFAERLAVLSFESLTGPDHEARVAELQRLDAHLGLPLVGGKDNLANRNHNGASSVTLRDDASGRKYDCEPQGIPCALHQRMVAFFLQHNERLYQNEPELPHFHAGCCDSRAAAHDHYNLSASWHSH